MAVGEQPLSEYIGVVGDVGRVTDRQSAIRREGDAGAVHAKAKVSAGRLENGPEAVVLLLR